MHVLTWLNETGFGRVALEGMQELFRDSCEQGDKTKHLHYGTLETLFFKIFSGKGNQCPHQEG